MHKHTFSLLLLFKSVNQNLPTASARFFDCHFLPKSQKLYSQLHLIFVLIQQRTIYGCRNRAIVLYISIMKTMFVKTVLPIRFEFQRLSTNINFMLFRCATRTKMEQINIRLMVEKCQKCAKNKMQKCIQFSS